MRRKIERENGKEGVSSMERMLGDNGMQQGRSRSRKRSLIGFADS
jgi:hypothetical protein